VVLKPRTKGRRGGKGGWGWYLHVSLGRVGSQSVYSQSRDEEVVADRARVRETPTVRCCAERATTHTHTRVALLHISRPGWVGLGCVEGYAETNDNGGSICTICTVLFLGGRDRGTPPPPSLMDFVHICTTSHAFIHYQLSTTFFAELYTNRARIKMHIAYLHTSFTTPYTSSTHTHHARTLCRSVNTVLFQEQNHPQNHVGV
jgi:hypothetical protein